MEPLLRTIFPAGLADIIADYADPYAVPIGKAKMACCMEINLTRTGVGQVMRRIGQPCYRAWLDLTTQVVQTTDMYGAWSELVSVFVREMVPKRQARIAVTEQERFMHTSHWNKKSGKWRCLCGSLSDNEGYFHSLVHRKTRHREATQSAKNSIWCITHR